MRARWIDAWGGSLQAGERDVPAPGPGEVLVAVEACGVGLTVLNCIRGDLSRGVATTPRIPGHEYVGRIVALGPGVDPAREHERVAAYFYRFCGHCRRCLAGEESICERLAGYVAVDIDGGYAPFAVLPARNAIPIPPDLDAAQATAIPDAISTPVHVVRRAALRAGERVCVIGAGGGLGIHMVQVARLHGADVVGVEANADKRAFIADALGVPAVAPDQALPWGADVVVDFVGREATLTWALDALDDGGRLVVLTTFQGVTVPIAPRDLVLRQLALVASRYASRHEVAQAAAFVADGRVRPVVSDTATLDDVQRLHQRLEDGDLLGRGALVFAEHARP